MSRAHAESVLESIIREILHECEVRGHAVSDTLVTFMVKAVVLDPRNGFNVNRILTKQDVQKVEELCVDKLMEKCSPALDAIQMQIYFDMNYTAQRDFLEEIHQVLEYNLGPVRREITDSRMKTREEFETLYHKIITYILLGSAISSPSDISAVQEARAALQSVFPQTELGAFIMLLKKDKEQQLGELTMIVTGILLFNKVGRKREEEINIHKLMPPIFQEGLSVVSNHIENELSVTQRLVWKYTAVLEKITYPDIEPGLCDTPIILLRQALYNKRQHELFLKVLLGDACLCAKHVEVLQTEFLSQMKLLKETIKSKTALPTASVFPLFKVLSQLWFQLQDQADYLDNLLEESEVKTDEQRMAESSDERIDPLQVKTQEWLWPETTASFNSLPLEYNGVCGYTFVNRDGLLLPGNPHIGVLKHKGKLYAFNSKKAALKFASRPDDFIAEVAEKAKCSPELIQLLKLHHFSHVTPYFEMQQEECLLVMSITKCESGTQTDIHLMEKNMVTSYEWNEWELRRKALKLADLRTKVTRSVQTDLSQGRRENITQTWLLLDTTCQSKRDDETVMAKPQIYVAALRGQRDEHVVKTNLTRSLDE
ncbi:cilia- and flagella-associated protein 206 isoform X2 [Mugil cephalus]|uniref:cilia- and flagella-associated protein 206 isoform X2 n=1 Tax=Mugil cephalus TaxID=48193 RepID=UPI001FB78468|nr:cilia- and flagella-associated protein 206 isoform X2 [Mugil cephalus]